MKHERRKEGRPLPHPVVAGVAEADTEQHERRCTCCAGEVALPCFVMDEGVLCAACLDRLTIREMQQVVRTNQLRGVLRF